MLDKYSRDGTRPPRDFYFGCMQASSASSTHDELPRVLERMNSSSHRNFPLRPHWPYKTCRNIERR
ncbi:hypothetical protein PVE_R2G0127 [Pseudomonas veronii 1YdBTEX2]|uniref:Uncharacterized protein n=1 Tax=Pseudomonas veronii 1YdBTEX2 TaxID=1295141 RepID=A0A1D3K760_PSEVE|nr:hypothetical protein PVE_R2G0127 [Pseudomonas veronii 1YdBTEX2]